MKLRTVEPEFVEFIPSQLAPDRLYVSMQYATTAHLCACGCGNKVVLPLSPAQWGLYFDGSTISLTPSIGNWQLTCRSHYWIKNSKILWAASWTKAQIEHRGRRDADELALYFSSRKAEETSRVSIAVNRQPYLARLSQWIKRSLWPRT